MLHPPKDALLDLALGIAGPGAGGLDRHLAACAECRAEVGRIRGTGASLTVDPGTTRGPHCLDSATIACLVEGTIPSADRMVAVSHLAGCSLCRSEVAGVAAALADPNVKAEVLAISRTRQSHRFLRVAIPVAAAAALMLFVTRPVAMRVGVNHRSPVITQTTAPVAGSPVGAVSSASSLTWHAVAGADRYRVTLFDAAGVVLYEVQIADTALALPDSISFTPGRTYLWKIEARSGWDRWVPSPLIRFHVEPPSP